ncbi:Anosmin-1 [Orchesella cincta]|uniref:Anosmin-1 n=1 Tax=Orchesella cincta TaxID=48709 RepID=A0A1D2N9F0_ORCCI|nr:Anosmin-1 [Orchesella cincta]
MSRKIVAVAGVVLLVCLLTVSESSAQTCGAPITSSKIGSCGGPNVVVFCMKCADECRADTDCRGTQKCCAYQGCSNKCKKL